MEDTCVEVLEEEFFEEDKDIDWNKLHKVCLLTWVRMCIYLMKGSD